MKRPTWELRYLGTELRNLGTSQLLNFSTSQVLVRSFVPSGFSPRSLPAGLGTLVLLGLLAALAAVELGALALLVGALSRR